MRTFLGLVGVVLIVLVLLDAFEAILLPRRVTRPYRYARLFYRNAWFLWRGLGTRLRPGKRRATFLSVFGPLSLLGLFFSWVVALVVGFGLLNWALMTAGDLSFTRYVYFSGTTFFTLGYGDITPVTWIGQCLAVAEAGLGFAFLAVIIGYLPVLFQASSKREVTISLLDARAGSPPTAVEFLRRLGQAHALETLDPFLAEWERWAAELLESHLSFPVLSFYRSQHDNQSWLAALTIVLDSCAVLIAAVKEYCPYQAQLTFAMARHAAVDLALVLQTPPLAPEPGRLSGEQWRRARERLCDAGVPLRDGPAVEQKLAELRAMYEPFVNALAALFLFDLPPLLTEKATVDNWQTSAWMRRTPGIGRLPVLGDEHFD